MTSASSRIFRSIGMATRFSIRSGAIPGNSADTTAVRMTMTGSSRLGKFGIENDAGDEQADHGRDGEAGPRKTKSRQEVHGVCSSRGRSFTFCPSTR